MKQEHSPENISDVGDIEYKLNTVCWNFKNSSTRNSLHSIHPYPAKFIPEIPRKLISLFHPGNDSAVFDPFCGSGTTMVESKNVGLASVGVDLSPLSTLITKVKTTLLTDDVNPIICDVLELAKKNLYNQSVIIPCIPNINHWFKEDVQLALAALIDAINIVPDQNTRDMLKVALSSIIVRVSNQESDTRYAAVEKDVTKDGVLAAFSRASISIFDMCKRTQSHSLNSACSVQIINKDIMQVQPDEIHHKIGLVITSPPYPNAYEYWLYHKYRMFWLGMDPLKVKEREIGARAHYFKKNHQTEHDFELQMKRCFWLLSKVMLKGSIACFVVGRSIIHGREIDNEAILNRAATSEGFKMVGLASREISVARKSFNLHHAKINREGIVLFRLEAA